MVFRQVIFDAKRWSANEPFRALATVIVPGQHETVIDVSATVCVQKLRLLESGRFMLDPYSALDVGMESPMLSINDCIRRC